MNLAELTEITNEEYYDLELSTWGNQGEFVIANRETGEPILMVEFTFSEEEKRCEGTPGETWIETHYEIDMKRVENCDTGKEMIFDRDEESECWEHLGDKIESKLG